MYLKTQKLIAVVIISLFQVQIRLCHAFTSSSAFVASSRSLLAASKGYYHHAPLRRKGTTATTLQMRDTSASYWFKIGDQVRVVDEVMKSGSVNLQGRIGVVQETWEKCDVDPTCCCAEQVDKNMAVRVKFEKGTNDDDESFSHYFAEEELEHVTIPQVTGDKTPIAFDGMSCKAFKLEQLDLESRPRRIASYDPNPTDE